MNRPIWTVTMSAPGKRAFSRERWSMYVRAATEEGARRTALANAFTKGARAEGARISTPQELGCVPVAA